MSARTRTAVHRPAVRRRWYRHDNPISIDLFSGFGGLTQGIKAAGFDVIMAANHNEYKVMVHEANHPEVEHWIADLVNKEAADYHDARDLPAADLLVAGVSCVNHSAANTRKAYEHGLSLFDLEDPDYQDRVTRSERDRATANCVLHYAAKHRPWMILVECTTELYSWGNLVPGKRKVGDGSTYKWWLTQFKNLGYKHKVLYLNSMFFGVPQSRDRGYWVFWDKSIPDPDLEHRPESWCHRCNTVIEAVQAWKTGVPQSGTVRYGKQYNYRCRSCFSEVIPPFTPSLKALDLSNLGTRIGDRKKPLASSTLARAERCRQRFAEFPAVLMPAKATRGSERHPWQPLATQTSQQETAVLSTGAIMQMANVSESPGSSCRTRDMSQPLWTMPASNSTALFTPPVALAIDNFQGAPRGADEPLPTQGGSETLAVISSGILPYRKNTVPTTHSEPMPTVTAEQIPAVLTQAFFPEIGGPAADEPSSLLASEWRSALADLKLEDCYLRMMRSPEVGVGCGFDVDFAGRKGTFQVWGSERDQVDGFGNAVSPPVGLWIGGRLRTALHGEVAA